MDRKQQSESAGVPKRVVKRISEQNLVGYAQIAAYNILFATAPFLMVVTAGAAAITRAVNSDLENPAQPILDWMQRTLPSETTAFLQKPIESAMTQSAGWVFSVGGLLALWGARGAINALMMGLNQAYGIEEDNRSFLKKNGTSLGLTLGIILIIGIGGLVFALGTDFGANIAGYLNMADAWNTVSGLLRWPLIVALTILAVVVLHRYGPAERSPWKAYVPGAVFTIVAGYLATLGLGLYFSIGGGYSEAYGVFGSVLAFIFWLFVMSLIALIGGAINGVLSDQRYGDTTVAEAEPVDSNI